MPVSSHETFLIEARNRRASDLHFVAGYAPLARVHGELVALANSPLSAQAIEAVIAAVVPERLKKSFIETRSADFGLDIGDGWRSRCNAYFTMGEPALAFRLIPNSVPSLAELGTPAIVETLATLPHGLILVTGPAGSGKSSTLAAMIDCVNATRRTHVATIEDPVEFVHAGRNSLITQREVGRDTPSFAGGLRDCLREDPNIILVGEIRDYETISLALRAAETGHLVLATLHTGTAPHAIDRFIDAFPGNEKETVRTVLSNTLRAVICQTLLRRADGNGRVAAFEILLCNPAIHNLIRENKTDQIVSAMQTGGRLGMQTMQAALERLVKQGIVAAKVPRETLTGIF